MNRTPSSGSSRLVSDISSSESSEDKQSEQSKNNKKMPIMRSGTQDQEVLQKRNAYKNSKGSTQTQATRNLQQDFTKPASTGFQGNTSITTTSTNPSYDVRSSSSRSTEPDETLPLTSMVPTLGTTSSTSSTTSTASSPVANPEWAKLDEQARGAEGCFLITKKIDFDVACKWLASSPAGVHSAFVLRQDLSHADVVTLVNSLKGNTTVNTLTFCVANLGPKGALVVAEVLKHNTTITTLDLVGDAIGIEGAQEVAEALKHNTTLTKLSLGLNDIGNGGAKAIAEALKYNTTLTSLDLSNNHIDYEGAKAIAEALKYNITLTSLKIGDADSPSQITRELNKNRELLETEKSAAAALEIIKNRLNSSNISKDTFYPQEIMDEVLTQMIQMGLKQEVIDLGNEITPLRKSPKS